MFRWSMVFLIIAVLMAIVGFGGIEIGGASIAKILCYIFGALFILSLTAEKPSKA
jgi:uncharacterized membrane protein YtjA (UPF0391 family)